MDYVLLGKSMFYFSIGAILALYIIFGIRFLRDSRKFNKGTEPREYYMGLGLFIISVAIGEFIYMWDLIFRTFLDRRLFLTLDSWGISDINDWQYYAGVKIASLINRDYYIVIFWILIISLSFLMKPLEKFISRREKPIITNLTRISIPLPLIFRILELNFYNWFGVQILYGSIQYYIFTGCWVFIAFIVVYGITTLIRLNYKMGFISAEKHPPNKKILVIFSGFFLAVTPFFFINSTQGIALILSLIFILLTFIYYIKEGLKSPTSSHLKKT